MPINYKEYHSKWTLIRRLILKRANNKCEECGVINHLWIIRGKRNEYEIAIPQEEGSTKIVLTISHQDHDKKNNRFINLKALCQKCHLAYDLPRHIENRKYGRNFRKGQFKIF